MKNMNRAILTIFVFIWIVPSSAFGQVEWEADIKVSAGQVESRLAIGQRSDATDLKDGRYDVPPMLSGSLRVRVTGGGGSLWRDIRSGDTTGVKEWQLLIDNRSEELVTISWSPLAFPVGAIVALSDSANGVSIDMKKNNSYTMPDTSGGEVLIGLNY